MIDHLRPPGWAGHQTVKTVLAEHVEGLGVMRRRRQVHFVHLENHQTGHCVWKSPLFHHRYPQCSGGSVQVRCPFLVEGVRYRIPF